MFLFGVLTMLLVAFPFPEGISFWQNSRRRVGLFLEGWVVLCCLVFALAQGKRTVQARRYIPVAVKSHSLSFGVMFETTSRRYGFVDSVRRAVGSERVIGLDWSGEDGLAQHQNTYLEYLLTPLRLDAHQPRRYPYILVMRSNHALLEEALVSFPRGRILLSISNTELLYRKSYVGVLMGNPSSAGATVSLSLGLQQ